MTLAVLGFIKARKAGVPLKSQAVLFRSSRHSGQLEVELHNRNIPFAKWGGIRFLEAAHIKDALSVLRWGQNPGDRIAASRALQLLPGIGAQTADAIFQKVSGPKFIKQLRPISPPKATSKDWPRFVGIISNIQQNRKPWPADTRPPAAAPRPRGWRCRSSITPACPLSMPSRWPRRWKRGRRRPTHRRLRVNKS